MKVFETKIRGFHAKTVENIMSRTISAPKHDKTCKSPTRKGDNIATYLRKFEIDRENLNLAKRILLCDSQHNHRKYEREWKKTEKFLRVRSNFKRNICNQEPRILKYEPILGYGNMLVTIDFLKLESTLVNFRDQNTYSIKILIRNQLVTHNNNQFTLSTLPQLTTVFHIPKMLKNKKIWCHISEIKQNNVYSKGKFFLKPSDEGSQHSLIINKNQKIIGVIHYNLLLRHSKQTPKQQLYDLSPHKTKHEESSQDENVNPSQQKKSPKQILRVKIAKIKEKNGQNETADDMMNLNSHCRNQSAIEPINSLR